MTLKRYSFIILIFILLINISGICYGNAAEPPSILIIVPNAPDDLEIGIGTDNTYVKAKKIDKLVEKHYIFYSREMEKASNNTINVKTNTDSYELDFENPSRIYQNIYTLNLKSKTLLSGKSTLRSITLVSLRIIFTLIIEGIVFYLFGFRDKRSWKIFVLINLLTQGALNIWINGLFPMQSYLFIGLIAREILIVVVESITIVSRVKEHSKIRRFLFVVLANFLSLVLGGYILTVLPY